MSDNKKRKVGLGISIWITAALGLLIIFVIKYKDISRNIQETAFFDRLRGKPAAEEQTPPAVQTMPEEGDGITEISLLPSVETGVPDEPSAADGSAGAPVTPPAGTPADVTTTPFVESAPQPAVPQLRETPEAAQLPARSQEPARTQRQASEQASRPVITDVRKTNVKLWFVQIDSDGSVSRREITRELPHTDSPLTAALQSLLNGPELAERNKGSMSLIPSGTKLLGASVRNGVASLNFSDAFEYSQSYGVEGYLAQLMQIVYTATSFPTVSSVQFLIEGQKKEYLGSEGVWIGGPLGRASFK